MLVVEVCSLSPWGCARSNHWWVGQKWAWFANRWPLGQKKIYSTFGLPSEVASCLFYCGCSSCVCCLCCCCCFPWILCHEEFTPATCPRPDPIPLRPQDWRRFPRACERSKRGYGCEVLPGSGREVQRSCGFGERSYCPLQWLQVIWTERNLDGRMLVKWSSCKCFIYSK